MPLVLIFNAYLLNCATGYVRSKANSGQKHFNISFRNPIVSIHKGNILTV